MSGNTLSDFTESITPSDLGSWMRLLRWCVFDPQRLAEYKTEVDKEGRALLRLTAAWTVNTLLFLPLMLFTWYGCSQPELLFRLGVARPPSLTSGLAHALAFDTVNTLLLLNGLLLVLAGLGIYVCGRGDSKGIANAAVLGLNFLACFMLGLTFAPIFALQSGESLVPLLALPPDFCLLVLGFGVVGVLVIVVSTERSRGSFILLAGLGLGLVLLYRPGSFTLLFLLVLIFGLLASVATAVSTELGVWGFTLPAGLVLGLALGTNVGNGELWGVDLWQSDRLLYGVFALVLAVAQFQARRWRQIRASERVGSEGVGHVAQE